MDIEKIKRLVQAVADNATDDIFVSDHDKHFSLLRFQDALADLKREAAKLQPLTVVVVMEGGLVQKVMTSAKGAEVYVKDYDTDSGQMDFLFQDVNGSDYALAVWDGGEVNPEFIAEFKEQITEEEAAHG